MISKMQFRGKWRDYQQRVLNELHEHLDDTKLHIVAAPGSGKTVLGLEVISELGHRTVILSPTLTIRNQWSERLFEMFLSPDEVQSGELSYDLGKPGTITSVTYQALHAVWKVEAEIDVQTHRPDFEALIEKLENETAITIVVDEAHHLRREWWRALIALVDALSNATLVALTATPPYDVSFAEWTRYDQLCGPIDAEISVPELVRNGDLCPHQDFIHFSIPKQSELELLEARRHGIGQLIAELLADTHFLKSLETHPWILDPEFWEEDVLDDPEFLSSMLIILAASGSVLPKIPLELLGIGNEHIPMLSPPWLEVFLNGYLFKYREHFVDDINRHKQVARTARQLGLIENNRVKLLESQALFKTMAGSLAKLDSIIDIAEQEHINLQDNLRMVVLSDYVRAADLPKKANDQFAPAKLGVVPIFEALRRAEIKERRLGVLTGSLIIIPETAIAALEKEVNQTDIPQDHIRTKPLPGCPGFAKLDIESGSSQKAVRLVTSLFNAGEIRVLAGTQALLGEGWDAPTINTLVLASNVGSYMLSNQIRGRAIRVDGNRPDKVANIWHLATVELQSRSLLPVIAERFEWNATSWPFRQELDRLGGDMRLLSKRFEMFEGISNGISDHISNGLERLNISSHGWVLENLNQNNAEMFSYASNRSGTAEKWRASLGDAQERNHVQKIAETNHAPRKASYMQTLQYLSISAVLGGFTSAAGAMRQFQSVRELATLALIFGGLSLLYSLPKLLIAARLLVRNGTLERSLKQVSEAVLDGLSFANLLKRHSSDYRVEIEPSLRGRFDIVLHNASRAEEKLFLDAMAEVLGPIENPRYLLVRKSWFGLWGRKDYHAVPAQLGSHKRLAEYFTTQWRKRVGPANLAFTRQKEGRRFLLKARAQSMAAGFQRMIDRRSQWR